MEQATDEATRPATGMTLDAAQTQAAEAFKQANVYAERTRQRYQQLVDDVRVLEEVLPVKQAARDRAERDYAVAATLVKEHFSLYRDLMELERPPARS